MFASSPMISAGAVVTRKGAQGREVLLVHRPKYDDWSIPKGKVDPGEHITETAIREVLEETGVEVRLGQALRPQRYHVKSGREKVVHYWIGHVLGGQDVSDHSVPGEIGEARWFDMDEATKTLTYLDDVALLEEVSEKRIGTRALILLRHATAVKRGEYEGKEDALRPLAKSGKQEAEKVSDILHAYGVTRVLSSPSERCVGTVGPYAARAVLQCESFPEVSEEGYQPGYARELVAAILHTRENAVLCTHRPILPDLLGHLGVEQDALAPAEMIVVHHRKGVTQSVERVAATAAY